MLERTINPNSNPRTNRNSSPKAIRKPKLTLKTDSNPKP